MKAKSLKEYFEKNCFEKDKIVIIGAVGSNQKTFSVVCGKRGIQVPAIFFNQIFKEKDVRLVTEGIFIPLLITDKKYISKEILDILKTSKSVLINETENCKDCGKLFPAEEKKAGWNLCEHCQAKKEV